MSAQERETILSIAYELGCDHARNAASWIVDGNSDREMAARLVAMIEEGDPRYESYLPARPNLSGEFADDLTPTALVDWCGMSADTGALEGLDAYAEAVQELCDEYERGVDDTFEDACLSELRAFIT